LIDTTPLHRQLADRTRQWGADHDLIALGPTCEKLESDWSRLPLVA